jgi:hypothetical protein
LRLEVSPGKGYVLASNFATIKGSPSSLADPITRRHKETLALA